MLSIPWWNRPRSGSILHAAPCSDGDTKAVSALGCTAAPATWQEPAVKDRKDTVFFGHCHREPLASQPTAAASVPGGIWCSGMGVAGSVQWLCKRQQSWTTGGCFLLLLGNPFSPTWLSEPLLLVSLLFQVTSSCGEKFFSHVLAMSVVFHSF